MNRTETEGERNPVRVKV